MDEQKKYAKEFFVHANKGRKPATTISDETSRSIIDLYRTKYYDANFRHFSELLEKHEKITVSPSCVSSILATHSIPYKFFTDLRTVFTYQKKNSPSLDEDTYTQFAYACKKLGVLLESSSVPQAKGRIERLNQTLQSHLLIELRLAGITTIDAANEFLNSYIKEFNEKFSLSIHGSKSVFETQFSDEKINLILAVLNERTVDCGHSIQFHHNHYRILDADYQKPKEKKRHMPPMNHPWRRSVFNKHVAARPHHYDDKKSAWNTGSYCQYFNYHRVGIQK